MSYQPSDIRKIVEDAIVQAVAEVEEKEVEKPWYTKILKGPIVAPAVQWGRTQQVRPRAIQQAPSNPYTEHSKGRSSDIYLQSFYRGNKK